MSRFCYLKEYIYENTKEILFEFIQILLSTH